MNVKVGRVLLIKFSRKFSKKKKKEREKRKRKTISLVKERHEEASHEHRPSVKFPLEFSSGRLFK